MSADWQVTLGTALDTESFGARLAPFLKPGDFIALTGDLGCGKTTLARGIIRALLFDPLDEIPSPTFTLVQSYDVARISVAHIDLYRIEDSSEVEELGIDEAIRDGIVIMEWPEKALEIVPPDHLEIRLEIDEEERRSVYLVGRGAWQDRLTRIREIEGFLKEAEWQEAQRVFLQGDASNRRYERLTKDYTSAILMDSPPSVRQEEIKDGKTYSEIAHLAHDIKPFVAVAEGLRSLALSAPEIYAAGSKRGFILLEDLGDNLFADMISSDVDMDIPYREAVEVLVTLATNKWPLLKNPFLTETYHLPEFDRDAFQVEVDLLPDWFWPALKDEAIAPSVRLKYSTLWGALYETLNASPQTPALRDYHSPNLLWLGERKASARIGIIDFQDAVMAPYGYDLVSMLQDARVDVAPETENTLFDHFIARMTALDEDFNEELFARTYAIWGAHRNSKILGIFARLAKRDNKRTYLRHIERVSHYLERNLAHPDLAGLKAWFDEYLPSKERASLMAVMEGDK